MRMRTWALLVSSCIGCGMGCDPAVPESASLEVYLRTDLSVDELADAEVQAIVRSAALGQSPEPVTLDAAELSTTRLGSAGGALVGVFLELEAGRYDVTLNVRGAGVPAEATATAVVDFVGMGAQQVVLLVLRDPTETCTTASDCSDVPCASETCVEGRCFASRTSDWTAACECDSDAGCAGAGSCGVGRCEAHACSVEASDDACGVTGVCRPDLSCDAVSCRGRSAGDECRPAEGPCDRGERCMAGERECPADMVRGIGEGCRDPGGATGFCVGDGSGPLTCETSCTAGSACQVGCLLGRTVCVPTPMCDTSGGAVAADGVLCAPGSTCIAPSLCSAGSCASGGITVDAFCGDDPFSECADRPVCNAAGVCEIQVRPVGSPCGAPGAAPVCNELRCAADGVCSPVRLMTDPRCPPVRVGECGIARCELGTSMDWGCGADVDPTYDCGEAPICSYGRFCGNNTLVCTNQPTFDGDPCYCGDNPNPFTCYDQMCEFCTSCVDGRANEGETDVDCGGDVGCDRCTVGLLCGNDYDCWSEVCQSGRCRENYCRDGMMDNDETDTDCGGPNCAPCGVGGSCTAASDCDSGNCTGSTCVCPGPGPGCA